MRFHKMNGAGNDFLILNNMDGSVSEAAYPILARTLCERHLSVGADGLMVVEPPQAGGDYRMRFFNSDGSAGEMCGNGARCICRYGYELGLAGEVQRVETTAGLVTGTRITERQYRVRLNDPSVVKADYPVEACGSVWPGAYIELGNPGVPHAVIPVERLDAIPEAELFSLGRALCRHPAYPKGANVNFCEVLSPEHICIRTYERGVEDFTYACGTGSGSSVLFLTMRGSVTGDAVCVSARGGDLYITVERDGDAVRNLWLTGPTNLVCVGEITDEELNL